jgi:hypothetical protein
VGGAAAFPVGIELLVVVFRAAEADDVSMPGERTPHSMSREVSSAGLMS